MLCNQKSLVKDKHFHSQQKFTPKWQIMASNSINHFLDQLCDSSTSLTIHSSMSNCHLPPPPLCCRRHLPFLPHAATTTIFSTPSPFYYHLHLPIPPHHATPPPPPLSLPLFHVDNISLFSSLRPASPPSHVLLPHMHIVNLRSTNTPKFSTSNASMDIPKTFLHMSSLCQEER